MAAFLPLSATKFPSLHPQDYQHRSPRKFLPQRGCYDQPFRSNKNFITSCTLARKQENYVMVEEQRPLSSFPPDIWDDRFENFTLEDEPRIERYGVVLEPLKEEVRAMLLDYSVDLVKKMNMIDAIERLGFAYYYQAEIEELLDHMFKQLGESNFDMDYI